MERVRKILSSNQLLHTVFWLLSFYAIGSYFSISSEIKIIDFVYSAFFHVPLVVLVYLNLNYHVPKFLLKERYAIYLLLSVFNISFAYFLHELVFEILIPVLPTDFYMVSFTDIIVLITIFTIYWGLTTLLRLAKSWSQLQHLEKEKLALELNSLKMQINPHFLFNSLNSMYSLARKKSEKTPDAILRLSNLMRYMIYEVSEDVSLAKEIDSINDYLDLQRLRIAEDAEISFHTEGEMENRMVAPLLFFPLVENSFKHGLKGEKGENYVKIRLVNDSKQLTFHVLNNKGKVDDVEESKYGGIGLENVRKRINLIYGDRATMNVNETLEQFEVSIEINWK